MNATVNVVPSSPPKTLNLNETEGKSGQTCTMEKDEVETSNQRIRHGRTSWIDTKSSTCLTIDIYQIISTVLGMYCAYVSIVVSPTVTLQFNFDLNHLIVRTLISVNNNGHYVHHRYTVQYMYSKLIFKFDKISKRLD